MIKKLILTLLLAAMLACTGTINAIVFATGRRHLEVETDTDRQEPDDESFGNPDESMQELVIKSKPTPKPILPAPAAPKPKPQPKPKPTPKPATPPPPKPTPPVTQPT